MPAVGIHPQQGDQTDPDRDAQVIAQQGRNPDGAHRGERHRQQDEHRLGDGPGIHIQEQENQEQGQGDHHQQALLNPLGRLELAAPGDSVTRWQFHLVLDQAGGFLDIAVGILAR